MINGMVIMKGCSAWTNLLPAFPGGGEENKENL
jgi:hypothetical protein